MNKLFVFLNLYELAFQFFANCFLRISISILLFFSSLFIHCQNPNYFGYNDENGLPSNEVYSIVQDQKGMIWIGCDAGLFKFDGVRYTTFHCETQNSKAISGLTLSSSGKLYCFNFQSQVFYLENGKLIELKGCPPPFITNLSADKNGNIYISYSGGVDIYNEKENIWKVVGKHNEKLIRSGNIYVAKTSRSSLEGKVFALRSNGIETFDPIENQFFSTSIFKDQSPGLFLLEYYRNRLWIFSAEKNLVYQFKDKKIQKVAKANLLRILSNRKITNVKSLSDGYLWICTYKGIIRYDAIHDKAELFYPEFSFSDAILDREGNYWFTSLQAGILRISNINMPVWTNRTTSSESEKISKIVDGGNYIYFATVNGSIGKIDKRTKELTTYHTGENGDVQSFDFESTTNSLWFNINNKLYCLRNNSIQHIQPKTITAIKKRKEIGTFVFLGSSNGLYINGKLLKSNYWIRDIVSIGDQWAWIATNSGLLKLNRNPTSWGIISSYFKDIQILSLDVSSQNNDLFAMTFDGKIKIISTNGSIQQIAHLPELVQGYKLKYYDNAIYVATNKGLWVYEIATRKWKNIDKLHGLASDNIQDLAILDKHVWLATGKGVQKIPVHSFKNGTRALVYLKKLAHGKNELVNSECLELNYDEPLFLFPEAVSYSSNGSFSYAYRINGKGSSWIRLPATIDKIAIQNIPIGNFQIELKVIDHNNQDSQNSIVIKGIVHPPFWESIWFIVLVVIAISVFIYFVFNIRVQAIQKKQKMEIERLNLENELRLSRESALKSQMNPHFVFNVLNSIKSYIYKNDKQQASQYLTEFSNLIRTFLHVSSRSEVSLAEELDMLRLYIDLEAMLIHHDFTFELEIEPNIDLNNTLIPSLIIQPFVENSFKHGLLHKKGNKRLKIVVSQLADQIIQVAIIDNGIGRKSAQLRRDKELGHESFATTAIEKRIQLLNRNTTLVNVEYEDLVENKHPSGTTVLIRIVIDEQ
jgi:ligand-binding sensor domain-containing protein/two-component sensor histidine kinase